MKVIKTEKTKGDGQKGETSSELEERVQPLIYPETQSLLKDLAQESNDKRAVWLYSTYLVGSELHLVGAEIKQLTAIIWNGKMVSLLKGPTQLGQKGAMTPEEALDSNI